MIIRIQVMVLMLLTGCIALAQEKPVTAGMKITRSVKIRKASYPLSSADMDHPVIIIEGNNITVDFSQAQLQGNRQTMDPDQYNGVAVLVRNSRKVTIRNVKARGYKIAIRAINVEGLVIENSDLSYNYRKKLNSTQEKEDISDWMSYHHNEKDEWLRYGAAIYLRDCDEATIKNVKVTGGQNGLMMTGSDNGLFYNNDFSFNSGIGIGLYRCKSNHFLFNRVNFNVRGYSHGVYRRGQDSAGFLVYEQSSNNVFFKNSATHSGDGFFLWAGQTTMDTGEGGCNDT
jgi:parallel beta-helix repeat protein